jgi:SAM-dependent methyltransferase
MMRGLRQIVRFNWPFYAGAAFAVALAALAIRRFPASASVRVALAVLLIGPPALWMVTSLLASWIVYDRSPLTRWAWISTALGFQPDAWINIHAGLDEATPALRTLFGNAPGRVFDIFDPVEMTEPSIARARRLARNEIAPEPADFRRLPVATGTLDVALLLLSAHELRTNQTRAALFAELRRVLGPGGRVVIAEHLRDWANFAAFGPGFLHFHSRRAWTRCFAGARFTIQREFSITPFVRVFVLRRLT